MSIFSKNEIQIANKMLSIYLIFKKCGLPKYVIREIMCHSHSGELLLTADQLLSFYIIKNFNVKIYACHLTAAILKNAALLGQALSLAIEIARIRAL